MFFKIKIALFCCFLEDVEYSSILFHCRSHCIVIILNEWAYFCDFYAYFFTLGPFFNSGPTV